MDDKSDTAERFLKAILKEKQDKESGQLKIFFGMCPGVGKTYSMLEEAQQKLKDGLNVVVGTINTHGRKDTEKLLENLPIIPEKWIKYKDTVFEEMDLKTITDTKPDLVLVDELAHTNVPGSKHLKRWQDVLEILDNGINVFTTLNVQHLESRKDLIESLTRIQVKETVPDLILERATYIELVDIPPADLLLRLKEGKVYLGEHSKIAATNFFKEETLTALREIALRFTAEKVEHDLHHILKGKGWKIHEKLLTLINLKSTSEKLIRRTRRLAFELDAPWVVMHVQLEGSFDDEQQILLNNYFNLARELGGEVITTHDIDPSIAIQRIIHQKNITHLVLERSILKSPFFKKIIQDNPRIDLILLKEEAELDQKKSSLFNKFLPSFFSSNYLLMLGSIIALTTLGLIIKAWIGYKAVGFIFLLGILAMSFYLGRIEIFFAALLSALSWDLFFIPPLFTFTINDSEDITIVIIYMVVAVLMGSITTQMRKKDLLLLKREENSQRLYEIEKDIATSANLTELLLIIEKRLEKYFPGKFTFYLRNNTDNFDYGHWKNSDNDKAAMLWTIQNGSSSGWSTKTLPAADRIYFPIKFFEKTVGVLAFHPKNDRPFSIDEENFIQTVNQQLGIFIERILFEESMKSLDLNEKIEKMHHAFFHAFNRFFLDPIKYLKRCLDENELKKTFPIEKVQEISQVLARYELNIYNTLLLAEIESGSLTSHIKQNSLNKFIEETISETQPLIHSKIIASLPSLVIYISFDFELLKLALKNLILAIAEISPTSVIHIKAEVYEKDFLIDVSNKNAFLPEDVLPYIFNKFYRIPPIKHSLGLEFALFKAIISIHEGEIEVMNDQAKGFQISMKIKRL